MKLTHNSLWPSSGLVGCLIRSPVCHNFNTGRKLHLCICKIMLCMNSGAYKEICKGKKTQGGYWKFFYILQKEITVINHLLFRALTSLPGWVFSSSLSTSWQLFFSTSLPRLLSYLIWLLYFAFRAILVPFFVYFFLIQTLNKKYFNLFTLPCLISLKIGPSAVFVYRHTISLAGL